MVAVFSQSSCEASFKKTPLKYKNFGTELLNRAHISGSKQSVVMKRVAVIGAGAAGLCSARHLSRYPEAFSVRVFERASALGGTWVYTDQTDSYDCDHPVHSGMYDALR